MVGISNYEKPETLEAAFSRARTRFSSSLVEHGRQAGAAAQERDQRREEGGREAPRVHEHPPRRHVEAEARRGAQGDGGGHQGVRHPVHVPPHIENQTDTLAGSIGAGAFIGCSGDGKIAAATRQDYAEAAAVVLTSAGHENKAYELAGDTAYSTQEFAAEVSRQTGKNLPFNNLPEAQYAELLGTFGLPKPVAEILADADANAAKGELEDSSGDLRRLIGHATTPFPGVVKASLAKLKLRFS